MSQTVAMILGVILSLSLLILSLICLALLKSAARADRARERANIAFQAERSELLDRVMTMKGYREFAPVPPALDLEPKPTPDIEDGFEPY